MSNGWNDPCSLVERLNTSSTDETLVILEQYDKDVHDCLLKEYIQDCLEKDRVDSMRDFLACFQNVFCRLGHVADGDDYNNPFFAIRVYIEAAIWNWPHTSDMDTVLINYPFVNSVE